MNITILTSIPKISKKIFGMGLMALIPFGIDAQNANIELQWQHADFKRNGIPGVSSFKAHEYMKSKGKQPAKVVVAIIDSGTETWHKDLKQNIWTNTDEIANNGIDDDKNGYIDDVHGWSFIGGKDGDVAQDNLEITRIYRALHPKFNGKDAASIAPADQKDYALYISLKEDFESRVANMQEEQLQVTAFVGMAEVAFDQLEKVLGKDFTPEQLLAYEPKTDAEKQNKAIAEQIGGTRSVIEEIKKYYGGQSDYMYNLDFDPRGIVGDNYNDPNERFYGNNHIDGPEALHGTHVAGIVGAVHNNDGMDGICNTAELMIIRCVPDGDERDKDVANAIRYATDNGARVINMSFGKGFSPFKGVVDAAIQYAESKGVLLVHAAGNDSKDTNVKPNFPTPRYDNGKSCTTWLEIGASGPSLDHLAADFSNYGNQTVDIFAPGVDVYATVLDNEYSPLSGTSMASPVTAGVAAAILSYYPNLTGAQVREIILNSGINYKKKKVAMPGDESTKVKFGELSKTGKVVNLYEALKLAEKIAK